MNRKVLLLFIPLLFVSCGRFEALQLKNDVPLSTLENSTRCLSTTGGGPCAVGTFAKDAFSELEFAIRVDEAGTSQSSDAAIELKLTGFRHDIKGSKSEIELQLIDDRMDANGHDRLERGEIWSFRLANESQKLVADVLCLEKFKCNDVITNLVWVEGNHIFTRQFHVDNNLSIGNEELGAPGEGSTIGDTYSPYRNSPTQGESFNFDGTSSAGDSTDLIVDAIESQQHPFEVPLVGATIPLVDAPSYFDPSALNFDLGLSGASLRSQAVGAPNNGSLQFSSHMIGPSTSFRTTDRIEKTFGTDVTVQLLRESAKDLMDLIGEPLCIGNLSLDNGGLSPPHKSHQNGLDIDLYFYGETRNTSGRCQSVDAVETPASFSPTKNLVMFERLYQKSLASDSRNNRYSVLYNLLIHTQLKDRLCRAAIEKYGRQELLDPSTDIYQVMRRLVPEDSHRDHVHVRLNCHTVGCRDVGFQLSRVPPCS